MKDSFIFEGKKYISAKRASGVSGYSSDYVGQLCRGGKLECRMVGRTWFVSEESLYLHKASISREEASRNRIENLRGPKPLTAIPSYIPLTKPASVPSPYLSSENVAADSSKADIITTEKSSNEVSLDSLKSDTITDKNTFSKVDIDSKTVIDSQKSSGIKSDLVIPDLAWNFIDLEQEEIKKKYLKDERPLLPDLTKKISAEVSSTEKLSAPIKSTKVPASSITPVSTISTSKAASDISKNIISPIAVDSKVSASTVVSIRGNVGATATSSNEVKKLSDQVREEFKKDADKIKLAKKRKPIITYDQLARSIILKRVLTSVTATAFLFAVTLSSFSFLSNPKVQSFSSDVLSSSKTIAANTYGVVEVMAYIVADSYKSVVAFFANPARLAVNTSDQIDQGNQQMSNDNTNNGLVVTSSSGISDADYLMKEKIRNSFSDEVKVNPDQSGTAGVITPVFREATGKDFVYVMVPVQDKEAVDSNK